MSVRFLCAALCLAWAANNCTAAAIPAPDVSDLSGHAADPFISGEAIRVLLFVRTDCPISKRYAPELQRISREFEGAPVQFWLVFPDPAETPQDVRKLVSEYKFPGTPLLDPKHELVRIAHATIAPEAAVFDRDNKLVYHGRIDDLYVDIGKSRPAPTVHDLENAVAAAIVGKTVRKAETQPVGCSLADIE
jgi:thiol-disulfide isomerase/thioredoxin